MSRCRASAVVFPLVTAVIVMMDGFTTVSADCGSFCSGPNHLLYAGSCYWIDNSSYTVGKNWSESMAGCDTVGNIYASTSGGLAIIDTTAKWNAINASFYPFAKSKIRKSGSAARQIDNHFYKIRKH